MDFDSDDCVEFDMNFEDDKFDFVRQILTPDEVLKNMEDTVAKINSVLQLPIGTVRTLMKHFKWNEARLMDGLYGEDQDEIFRELEIPNSFSPTPTKVVKKKKLDGEAQSECKVCFYVFPSSEFVGLECDHRFCNDCWNGHLNNKILDQGTDRISCLQLKCDTLMDQEMCLEILRDERARQIYKRLITNSFVECNLHLLWCPNPSCGNVIKVEHKQKMELIRCNCNFRFCCKCLKDWHSPLNCELFQKWLTKCEVDSETERWLLTKSKPCPKCKIRIQKNGGCNHMICKHSNCGYEFCWICMEVWGTNRPGGFHICLIEDDAAMKKEEEKDQKNLLKEALDWYLLHYKRYVAHKQSLELEEKLVVKIKVTVDQLIQGGVPAVDAGILDYGVLCLNRCRKTLMYTYPFAYFLNEEHNQTEIFKNNQADLQRATEELSGYLEREIDQSRFIDFKDELSQLGQYCEQRCSALEKHIKEGYTGFEGITDTKWKFTETLLN